jgi:hypothetical protein
VRAVWSTVQGDPPSAIVTREWSLDDPVQTFDAPASVVVPAPQQPPPISTHPTTPEEPPQMSDLQAPDALSVIKLVFAEHPEIDTKTDDDDVRGKIVDWCCYSLNGEVQRGKPWGRQARNKDGSGKNGDALTYLRTDNRFEIYDIINGADGKAMWGKPSRHLAQGENGYWAPADPVNVAQPQPGQPPTSQPPIANLGPFVLDLSAAFAPLLVRLEKAERKLAELEQRPQSGDSFPTKIALKIHGRYLSVDPDGAIEWNREAIGAWETIEAEQVKD